LTLEIADLDVRWRKLVVDPEKGGLSRSAPEWWPLATLFSGPSATGIFRRKPARGNSYQDDLGFEREREREEFPVN
jgi:hypothetical protein